MNAIVLKKGVLAALFFFILNLFTFADDDAQLFYKIGYDYSQQGRNNEAFHYMLRAADMGHSAAQNNIGLSYLHGLGVGKDKKKAFSYFQKAANQGLSYAQSELAMLYYQQGDSQQAQKLWLLAAKKNDEYAQFNLASLFLEQGDKAQAYYWFKRASGNQHPDADIALKKLEKDYVK